ncbi:MAG TPA: hypothetical protein VLG11_02705 [Candidatus Saccharimonadales bacterium]|nr:hypothetical protein [Candidatus Saccharimonadales bacterium]
MGKKDIEAEDLAIQDTLSMDVEERLKLLAALIVDKIDQDQRNDQTLLKALMRGMPNA